MALTEVLARYGVAVLDIGQSVIHDTLALGLLVELTEEPAGCPAFKELLFAAHDLGLAVRLTPVDPNDATKPYREHATRRLCFAGAARTTSAQSPSPSPSAKGQSTGLSVTE
jgi:ACT domain-containing protein